MVKGLYEATSYYNDVLTVGATMATVRQGLETHRSALNGLRDAHSNVLNSLLQLTDCDDEVGQLSSLFDVNDHLGGLGGWQQYFAAAAAGMPLIVTNASGAQYASVGGNRADYAVTSGVDNARVIDGQAITLSGGVLDAPAIFENLAKITFADRAYNLEIAAKASLVQPDVLDDIVDLYVAYFNRVPEASGLSYWIDQYLAGKSLAVMAGDFYAAGIQFAEVTGYTSDMPLSDFIKVLYANVLGRSGDSAPPQADIDYWLDQVGTGAVTREGMVARFLNDARLFYDDPNVGWVPRLLDQKVEFGKLHAVTYGLDYNDQQTSIETTVELAAAVTPDGYGAAVQIVGLSADDYLAALGL